MWIIPKTLSAYVPDMEGSSLELSELAEMCEQSLMWRSKPTRSRIWLRRLKKVKWIQRLSGRILKPSMQSRFVEKYTDSLLDIPVNHLVTPANVWEKKTLDTFGHILKNTYVQSNLFGASLKMSADIYQKGLKKWSSECPESGSGKKILKKEKGLRRNRPSNTSTDLADADGERIQRNEPKGGNSPERSVNELCFDRWPARPGQKQYEWEKPRTIESGMGRTVDGFASRVDELRLLGNGVVPQTAELAFKTLVRKVNEKKSHNEN